VEKKLLETLQNLCQDWQGKPIRLMFQDEARFGRINDVRRCWAPKPMRPLCQAMLTHEYTYAYASCEPATGTMDALILPQPIFVNFHPFSRPSWPQTRMNAGLCKKSEM
jgi:hypothetical protein